MSLKSVVLPGLKGPAYICGFVLCMLLPVASAAQTPKYGITVNIDDKKADFAVIKKYAWQRGQASFDKAIDAAIVAAVDDELAKLGMVKDAPESAQVLVTYASTNRTDVDLKGKPDPGGVRPKYRVGTLVVAFLDAKTRNRLLRLRVDQPIDADPDALQATIRNVVTQMFEQYPTRQKK